MVVEAARGGRRVSNRAVEVLAVVIGEEGPVGRSHGFRTGEMEKRVEVAEVEQEEGQWGQDWDFGDMKDKKSQDKS